MERPLRTVGVVVLDTVVTMILALPVVYVAARHLPTFDSSPHLSLWTHILLTSVLIFYLTRVLHHVRRRFYPGVAPLLHDATLVHITAVLVNWDLAKDIL